jgi:hypothetical protein
MINRNNIHDIREFQTISAVLGNFLYAEREQALLCIGFWMPYKDNINISIKTFGDII